MFGFLIFTEVQAQENYESEPTGTHVQVPYRVNSLAEFIQSSVTVENSKATKDVVELWAELFNRSRISRTLKTSPNLNASIYIPLQQKAQPGAFAVMILVPVRGDISDRKTPQIRNRNQDENEFLKAIEIAAKKATGYQRVEKIELRSTKWGTLRVGPYNGRVAVRIGVTLSGNGETAICSMITYLAKRGEESLQMNGSSVRLVRLKSRDKDAKRDWGDVLERISVDGGDPERMELD